MFFKDYLNSTAECLDLKLNGFKQQTHSGDIGELCEIFVKDFLEESFSKNFRIFRGGHIINIQNKKSEQLDIILCSQNSIKIFSDKGLYPIETVFGVINIKKELTHTNLFSKIKKDCGIIENFKSIPKEDVRLHTSFLNKDKVLENFKRRFPYKIAFAYKGKILPSWETELNKIVEENPQTINFLPDLIIVNKQGVIYKCPDGVCTFTTGDSEKKFFHFSQITEKGMYYVPYIQILNELYKNSTHQYIITPKYEDYFNIDLIN